MSASSEDEATLRRAAVMWAFVVQRQAEKLFEAVDELNATDRSRSGTA